ncbi:hypothetical protein Tco_0859159 [Tanacetum coccineum]|uniref:F-box protein n=1 Tax=Tanacetum coccineum TaxID=301880 RepID=A0ABQ5BEJ2_9ASTR
MENSSTLASTEAVKNVKIVQSCNGLLLCTGSGWPACYYVFNSPTNLFKRLPPLDYSDADSPFYLSDGLRMAFNPTKSWKLFKSHGCLLAVLRHYFGSREFTIYEMRKGCSVWSVGYLVNTDDFMNPLLEGWSIWSTIWSIVLGEREDDSCFVINLSRKVIQYNLISKTLHEIYDIGYNQRDDNLVVDELIMPFRADHSVYEFILSSVSV